ncbi:MAG: site-2 protease family protein [Ruminococcaceae bacterium]|nr:site-2 protease family protein [Oscillospiraceae bacterium]
MLRTLFGNGDITEYLKDLLLSLPIVLLAISAHEAAHGYTAYRLGDPTAKNLGRLTLNPIKHIDPIGFICMLLAGVGWANPVPINTRNFKKPRRDMALSGAAGPIANILLGMVFTLMYKFAFPALNKMYAGGMISYELGLLILDFLFIGISLNITFAIFNLLPVPPFDGSRIFYAFLPPKYYFGVMKYERYIGLVVLLLLVFGIISPIVSFVSTGIMRLMFFVFGI